MRHTLTGREGGLAAAAVILRRLGSGVPVVDTFKQRGQAHLPVNVLRFDNAGFALHLRTVSHEVGCAKT